MENRKPVINQAHIQPGIFREYDIRGIVGSELNAGSYYSIGRAIGRYAGANGTSGRPSIVLGRDCRLESKEFQQALISGMNEAGLDPIDLGMVPTPVMYFAQKKWETDFGAVVTASHNPKEYNGLKLTSRHGPVFGEQLQNIRTLTTWFPYQAQNALTRKMDISSDYLNTLSSNVRLKRPLKVVLDTGNGAAGPLAAALYRRLGCEVTELFTEPDGRFPNHIADPTLPESMKTLQETVVAQGADVGIGLDGDGDRIGAVDEQGQLWAGDRLLRLFARSILPDRVASSVVFDVKCSRELIEDIERLGGKADMWRTGYPHIRSRMHASGSPLGGEMSGHIYFADRYFGFDDGLYAGARLLEILAESGSVLSQRLPPPRLFATPEIRIECSDRLKFRILDEIRSRPSATGTVISVDGVRIEQSAGWILVRASNTQSVLVVRAEHETRAGLQELLAQLAELLRPFDINPESWVNASLLQHI